jgi:hypothetical protein
MSKNITDIKNTKVIKIYELTDDFEIVYLKDGIEKSFTIYHRCNFGPRGNGCWFEISGIPLEQQNYFGKKIISTRLLDIDTIVDIHIYHTKSKGGFDECHYEDLEIVYKDKNNQTNSYLLNSVPHEEDVHGLDVCKNQKSKLAKYELENTPYPKESYSTKVYKDALSFALKAHKNQKTPEGLPYSFHICSVANEVINSLSMHRMSYDEANVAVACALLHDVNEDTEEKVSKYTLEIENIDEITAGVEALTKDETLPSKQEQMADSIKRLENLPYCIQMVKLADRITNLAPAPLFWNKVKRKSYLDEAKYILENLKDSNPYLATKLQERIDNYQVDTALGDSGFANRLRDIVDEYLVFFSADSQLILDKSHKNYIKTFKAINRLNEYCDNKLFDSWKNIQKKQLKEYKNTLNINYLKDNTNKNDEKVIDYLSRIAEEVIVRR